jgi:glycosyltransferase involved in cell wall biosynthesis
VQAKLKPEVALVMPVFNEADGIAEFLEEINAAFDELTVVVVDDHSTDTTAAVIAGLTVDHLSLWVETSEHNRGHGPSTLKALRLGLATGARVIVAVDGDGQVHAEEIRKLLVHFFQCGGDVMEGVRTGRHESSYRAVTSWATRVITRVRARGMVQDANTPFRVYAPDALSRLLDAIPHESMVPNLWMTVAARRLGLVVNSTTVETRPRRGTTATGSTWGKSRVSLPSRRFVRFCVQATTEWFVRWPQIRRSMHTRPSDRSN